jgi:hypothetical protein
MTWKQMMSFGAALGLAGLCPAQDQTPKISKLGLTISYQRETGELAKRDLALKIIDSGILKIGESTAEDVAKIFGKDWAPDLKVEKGESYGIISFAKQPPETPAGHVAGDGWYMVVYYSSTSKKVFDWDLSNVHK